MSRVLLLIMVVALAACASPSPEKVELSADARAKVAATDSGEYADDVYCRKIKPTGSHRYKKICFTNEEWAKMRESGQDALGRHNSSCAGGMACGSSD